MIKINLKELLLEEISYDNSPYDLFNKKISANNFQFVINDAIWCSLEAIWNNKYDLDSYFNSMIKTYSKMGHDEALRYMGKIDTKSRSMEYQDDNIENCIKVRNDCKYVYNGRNRIILYHYLFSKINSADYNIYVMKDK